MARFEYARDTIQELYVQTYMVYANAIKELRVLRQPTSPLVLAGDWTATATSLGFDTLAGTIPPKGVFLCGTEKVQYGGITWTSTSAGTFTSCKRGWEGTTAAIHLASVPIYFADAFAWIATSISNSTTTIVFSSLDRPGQIPETGIIFTGNEWIYYGGVSYSDANKTAGSLLYCLRGYNGTTAAAHDGSTTAIPIRFEDVFYQRENVALYNYSGSTSILHYGFNPTITAAGTNALPLAHSDSVVIPIGPSVRVYAINDSTSGIVAIAEWR